MGSDPVFTSDQIHTHTVWSMTKDQGDGSVYTQIFASEKEAEQYEEDMNKKEDGGWGESSVQEYELQFNGEGKLLNGALPYGADDDDDEEDLGPFNGLYWQADPPEEPGFFLHLIRPSKIPKCFIIHDHDGELKALLAGVHIPVKDIDAKNPTGLWLGPIPGPDED